jgi:hypothetical protein
MPKFVKGLELSRLYFSGAVRPVLERRFPKLKYSAAVIGWGSEVLGFDDEMSTDHHWGPRLLLFLGEKDHLKFADKIAAALSAELPYSFNGYSTSYGDPEPNGVRVMTDNSDGPVDHMVQCFTTKSFVEARLGVDPYKKLAPRDWLSIPQQRLLEVTSGSVYHDGLTARLEKIRQKFRYFPDDVWLYLLAAQWKKISQEEAFVGRAGSRGDELGSRIIATRIIREMMLLCFLMERRYAPYSKWLGTAFARLKIARKLIPIFETILRADNWKLRETHLSNAYSILARAHNKLQITESMPIKTSKYFTRPFNVIHADNFADAIRKGIKSRAVRDLKPYVGSIDQFVDSTDVLSDIALCRQLQDVY